ncbi:unnamed protein product [Taenia asiatica]|uniref:Protein kinase domain-containing protein n=1 Tax=Taenia asiatica TaxID=60517 RepID=A0A0R3W1W5_TAEAS|nr:unnamed protein product [Taenia asiatica]
MKLDWRLEELPEVDRASEIPGILYLTEAIFEVGWTDTSLDCVAYTFLEFLGIGSGGKTPSSPRLDLGLINEALYTNLFTLQRWLDAVSSARFSTTVCLMASIVMLRPLDVCSSSSR